LSDDKPVEGKLVPVTPADATPQPEYAAFVETIRMLRSPDGCPWDREQTHATIARNMIEEAYEAVAAIEDDDVEHLREELGDVLLQVVLQARIAEDAGEFTIEDVAHDVNAKMIRRHPHVFGTQAAFQAAGIDPDSIETGADVLPMWDRIKTHEKQMKSAARAKRREAAGLDPDTPEGLLDDVPRCQPALAQAQEVSRKTARIGFEWETVDDVWHQVSSEIAEFKAEPRGSEAAELEMGDILFALVNVARREGIDAESALRHSCDKFRRRWSAMEDATRAAGDSITEVGGERLETLWRDAKAGECSGVDRTSSE